MKTSCIYEQLVTELRNILSSERLVLEFLPLLIEATTLEELKEAFENNLEETVNQLLRVEKILAILGLKPNEKYQYAPVRDIIIKTQEIVADGVKSSNLDVTILSSYQKIKNYEIARYAALENCAIQLDFNSEIIALIHNSYNEKCAFDQKLKRIAEDYLVLNVNMAEESVLNYCES